MVKSWRMLTGLALFVFLVLASFSKLNASQVVELSIKGPIGPATTDYITRGINRGQEADLILILLDTPGGLDASTRVIMQSFLSSKVPIVTFVSPKGARAASAGTYLMYASTLAAMAPGTELGAASPVHLGGGFNATKQEQTTEDKKIMNDSLATIRSLAQLRKRDPHFAEKAVLNASSMTSEEALRAGVINYIAVDVPHLLNQLNNSAVTQNNQTLILNIKNAQIERIQPDWFTEFLSVITNPTIAYLLLLIGIYGIFFELFNPGFVLPGVIGSLAILIALYALQLLPINYVGFSLLILGIFFIIAEGFAPSFGALGLGGTVAFVLGSVMLINTNELGYKIAWSAIAVMAVVNFFIFVLLVGAVVKTRRQTIKNGLSVLVGAKGRTLQSINLQGQAVIRGEIWNVQAKAPIPADTCIRVLDAKGLVLEVEAE